MVRTRTGPVYTWLDREALHTIFKLQSTYALLSRLPKLGRYSLRLSKVLVERERDFPGPAHFVVISAVSVDQRMFGLEQSSSWT